MMNFSAVILAAGYSTRMGSFKSVMPLGRSTIVGTAISSFRKAGIEDILVVAGHRREELRAHVSGTGATVVDNPNPEQGMFSSVRTGVKRLPPDCRGFFILPVDIPLCRPYTYVLLGRKFEKIEPAVISPVFQSREGHPLLISGKLAHEILGAGAETSLKDILYTHRDQSMQVEVPDRNILFDADTPRAYDELKQRAKQQYIPTPEECEVIHRIAGAPGPGVWNHCRAVANVAVQIGFALNRAGARVDIDLIRAGALLHDVVRHKENHAIEAGRLLREMGFETVGDIVSKHTEMAVPDCLEMQEAEVLFLADKIVQEETLVPLENRFRAALDRYGKDPEASRCIKRRWRRAVSIKERLDRKLNYSLETLFHQTG